MSFLEFSWLRRAERLPGARPVLSVEDLSVKVGIRQVLKSVCLDVYAGDQVLITGSNGSGKSTLLNAIAGVDPARVIHGKVRFRGEEIADWPAYKRARLGLAYMRQIDHVFPSLTVGENLRLALGHDGYPRFREAFPDWAVALPFNGQVGRLSGGQRKKLAWAMTTLSSFHLALTDEPEAGVSGTLRLPAGGAILIVSHQIMANPESTGRN